MSQLGDLDGLIQTALTPILSLTTPEVKALDMQPFFSLEDAFNVVQDRNKQMPAILFCNGGEAVSMDPRAVSTEHCQINGRFAYLVAVLTNNEGNTAKRFTEFHYPVRDQIIFNLAGIVYSNTVKSSTFDTQVAKIDYLGMEAAINNPDVSAVMYRFQIHAFYNARKDPT